LYNLLVLHLISNTFCFSCISGLSLNLPASGLGWLPRSHLALSSAFTALAVLPQPLPIKNCLDYITASPSPVITNICYLITLCIQTTETRYDAKMHGKIVTHKYNEFQLHDLPLLYTV